MINKKKRWILPLLLAPLAAVAAPSDTLRVSEADCVGPYAVQMPYMVDSLNRAHKKMELTELLKTNAGLLADRADHGRTKMARGAALSQKDALYAFHFTLRADRFVKGKLLLPHLKNYQLYVDGYEHKGTDLTLRPRQYNICVVALAAEKDTFDVSYAFPTGGRVEVNPTSDRPFSLVEQNGGPNYRGVSLSPSGKFLLTDYYETDAKGNSRFWGTLTETDGGRVLQRYDGGRPGSWMPRSERLYRTVQQGNRRMLVAIDPTTQAQTVLATDIPQGSFTIAPTEDFLIYTLRDDVKEKEGDLRLLESPDDRQPGWRTRVSLYRYDLKTGVMQRLTYGAHSASMADLSPDGKRMLLMVRRESWAQRPFYRTTLLEMNLQTLQVDTLIANDGTLAGASYSPDGRQLLVKAWADAFDGIGKKLLPGQLPSMYDYQLYLYDLSTRKARAMTRDFNPSVESTVWSAADGKIYFTATDGDCLHGYVLEPKSGKIKQLDLTVDYVQGFSLAEHGRRMAWYGQSATTSRQLFVATPGGKPQPAGDIHFNELFKGVAINPVSTYRFRTQRGDTISGFFIEPYQFNAQKRYPLIVYYYGGCTPSSRILEFFYPWQVMAGQGYGVLVLNPSGTIGYGQEFAARHVNAWGKRTADDIIEGVRSFFRSHSWVDSTKIGCMGASYGGFMTQYLLTQTDLFAAAISHAGISNIASYWGGGYWGYSYNEVAAMGSYPWNNPDLYVKQSPLFMAEKIHTPLLLMHGTADTNVPTNESQQMYTALKMLGRPVSYIQIKGANHVVTEFNEREACRETIFAWFARQLKGQSAWWDDLYGPDK